MENRFQKYKDLYYRYLPSMNVWEILFDYKKGVSTWRYNADEYRIDQCFDMVYDELRAMALMIKRHNDFLIWGDKK